jgi:hypothetical protein
MARRGIRDDRAVPASFDQWDTPVLHGSISLDPVRAGKNAGRVFDEALQNLASLPGADVESRSRSRRGYREACRRMW